MKAELLCNPENQLGEGPVWSEAENCLYWVDIREPGLFRFDENGVRHFPMPVMPGCLAIRRSGGLAVALQGGIHSFDPDTQELQLLVDVEPDRPENRPNDGRCDAGGRFWLGTMVDRNRYTGGSLYRIDDEGAVAMLTDIAVPNSIQFSPDGGTLYFSDTPTGQIWAYDLESGGAVIGNRRLLVAPSVLPGKPDGSAMDSEGCLWNARFGAGCIARITPDGGCDRLIPVPVSQVSSCTFGGTDGRTLYVTSAKQNLGPDSLAAEPLAGAVFAIPTGVTGIPERTYAW
ncbi:MAG: SMP-30/gluconolactonase/LRE family protein [Rhizobiaceae bacterium]